MSQLPLVPTQLVAEFRAFARVHDMRRQELKKALLTNVYSSLDKRRIVVVLKDRVAPGSDRRKFYPEVKGATLHIQANECGPFSKGSGSFAQVVTDLEGNKLRPIVDFAKVKGGYVAPGGNRAIFDAPTLMVLKAYQDQNVVTISKLTPYVDGEEAWIHEDAMCVVPKNQALPPECEKYTPAFQALLVRLHKVATIELHYGIIG